MEEKESIQKLIMDWDKKYREAFNAAEKLGWTITERLKPLYPHISFEVGGYEEFPEHLKIYLNNNISPPLSPEKVLEEFYKEYMELEDYFLKLLPLEGEVWISCEGYVKKEDYERVIKLLDGLNKK